VNLDKLMASEAATLSSGGRNQLSFTFTGIVSAEGISGDVELWRIWSSLLSRAAARITHLHIWSAKGACKHLNNIVENAESMITQATAEFVRLDMSVINAGFSAAVDGETMTSDQRQRVMDTKVKGFFCVSCVARQMRLHGSGKIIKTASVCGISAASRVSHASYVASRATVLVFTRKLAVEWAHRGLQAGALAPRFSRSDQTIWAFEQNEELDEKLLANVCMARIGKLEGGTMVYLASSVLDYMHGAKLILDGGFLSW
jgi:2-deoxy-D-gluconate 3-dehydrogenase